MRSKITEALQEERRERTLEMLRIRELEEYRAYLAERRNPGPLNERRNDTTGY